TPSVLNCTVVPCRSCVLGELFSILYGIVASRPGASVRLGRPTVTAHGLDMPAAVVAASVAIRATYASTTHATHVPAKPAMALTSFSAVPIPGPRLPPQP